MNGYDLTAPAAPLTGEEQSVSSLMQPDERVVRYRGYSVELLQAALNQAERTLTPGVQSEVANRLAVAKRLAVYGWFQWEFFTVSLWWSLSTIEMALKHKLVSRFNGAFSLVKKKATQPLAGSFERLEECFHDGWRISGFPRMNGSFHSLLEWARDENVLPPNTPVVLQELRHGFNNLSACRVFADRARADGVLITANPTRADVDAHWSSLSEAQRANYRPRSIDVLVEELPKLRNELAHPASYNQVLMLRSAVEGYSQAVEFVNLLNQP